jgi:hypothetical protein
MLPVGSEVGYRVERSRYALDMEGFWLRDKYRIIAVSRRLGPRPITMPGGGTYSLSFFLAPLPNYAIPGYQDFAPPRISEPRAGMFKICEK